jgi:hypothetical protein
MLGTKKLRECRERFFEQVAHVLILERDAAQHLANVISADTLTVVGELVASFTVEPVVSDNVDGPVKLRFER